jgi:protein-disulfide isomerase
VKRGLFVAAALALVAAFVFAAWWVRERRADRLGSLATASGAPFVRPHSPTLGPADARVVLVEFTDPACETCAAMAPVLKRLIDAYPGKVRLVVRYAPLHAGAPDVVRILEAARLQGRYWETLDLLYLNQGAWTVHHQVLVDRVWALVPHAGVDVERLHRDVDDPSVTAVLEQDLADAAALGVRRTPGIFVNGKPLEPFGVQPLAALVAAEVRAQYPD